MSLLESLELQGDAEAVKELNRRIKEVQKNVNKASDDVSMVEIQPALKWLADARMTIGAILSKLTITEKGIVRRGHVGYVLRDKRGRFVAWR
jgi:hypothetical protein